MGEFLGWRPVGSSQGRWGPLDMAPVFIEGDGVLPSSTVTLGGRRDLFWLSGQGWFIKDGTWNCL